MELNQTQVKLLNTWKRKNVFYNQMNSLYRIVFTLIFNNIFKIGYNIMRSLTDNLMIELVI